MEKYQEMIRRDGAGAFWDVVATPEGVQLRDRIGDLHGSCHGDTRVAPGAACSAMQFDGSSWVEVPSTSLFDGEAFSLELWMQSTQEWTAPYFSDSLWDNRVYRGSATLVSRGSAHRADGGWRMVGASGLPGVNSSGHIVGVSGAPDNFYDKMLLSPRGLNDGQWHHLVWTRDAQGINRLYVDGCQCDVLGDGGASLAIGRGLAIGGDPLCPDSPFFHGALSGIAFYPHVLSAGVIEKHHAEGTECAPAPSTASSLSQSDAITLRNDAGVEWTIPSGRDGWCGGGVSLNGAQLAGWGGHGMLLLRHRRTREVRCFRTELSAPAQPGRVAFRACAEVEEVRVQATLALSLLPVERVAFVDVTWSVSKEGLDDWEIAVSCPGAFDGEWRCQHYPFAGNSPALALDRMAYCGVPGVLLYRPDLSACLFFAQDAHSDYLNPNTWSGRTGFVFKDRQTPPQFRVAGPFVPGEDYRLPLQVFFSNAGESAAAITQIAESWLRVSHYAVEERVPLRRHDEALDLFMQGRRKTSMWIPGVGYELNARCNFVYVVNSGQSAFLEYLLYERTGDPFWRERAFAQADFALRAQRNDPSDPHTGHIHACYNIADDPARGIRGGTFDSRDRENPGLKPDFNAHLARYLLRLWQRVKEHEGVDRKDWYDAAVRCALWVARQLNRDGGLPQMVCEETGRKSVSTVSHRALPAMPEIARITGDDRFAACAQSLERFLRERVEGRFWFTGAHPDLPANDYEQDSIWGAVEYWLNRHDESAQDEHLRRARADALYGLLHWCPKQLSWVENPTQCAHSEQMNYCQYAVYCYQNTKALSLRRLGEKTGDPLFTALARRVIWNNLYTQIPQGEYAGAFTDAIADPWLDRLNGPNWRGVAYMNELTVDLMLQLLAMGC
jgi:hypothetical protein